ncbi:MAG: GtrA family protein [Patescibacteria group bacterium]|nr:GtrA family protein [Patescibacteria group bacterium]
MANETTVVGGENKLLKQISKFASVGVLNTAIDFLVFNLLVKLGVNVIISSVISMTLAITNSYILNKFWTFQDKTKTNITEQASFFVIVSLVGLLLSNSVLYFFYNIWTFPANLALDIVKAISLDKIFSDNFVISNFAKVCGILMAMVWNFIAYKKLVFKSK